MGNRAEMTSLAYQIGFPLLDLFAIIALHHVACHPATIIL
jgi:hypothetical protein